jgi:hypothetical protein
MMHRLRRQSGKQSETIKYLGINVMKETTVILMKTKND